jgi:hypothetical protein
MNYVDFIGVVVPILIVIVVSWAPRFIYDPIETQTENVIDELKNAGLDPAIAPTAHTLAAALARGAVLAASVWSALIAYGWGVYSGIGKVQNQEVWLVGLAVWGMLAGGYVATAMSGAKFHRLTLQEVRRISPKPGQSTYKFTQAQVINWIITFSGLLIVALAVAGFVWPAPPAAVPAPPSAA